MPTAEFIRQFFVLVISGIATISILLVILFLGAFILDLLSKGWAEKIERESKEKSVREWTERES